MRAVPTCNRRVATTVGMAAYCREHGIQAQAADRAGNWLDDIRWNGPGA